jgi:hypothetical protein
MKILLFFLAIFANLSLAAKVKDHSKIRVTSIFFPTDNGRWTDKIISSFHKTLAESPKSFQFTQVSYHFSKTKEKEFLKEVKRTKPDFVFLPDDFLYKKFASKIQKKTKAIVLFATLYQKKEELKKGLNQRGVFCEAPVVKFFEHISKSTKKNVKSVLFVGGPFAPEIIESLEKKTPTNIKKKRLVTSSWEAYKKAATQEAKEGGVIFTLAPFGVKKISGETVSDKEFLEFLTALKGVSLGYGRIDSYPRTFSLGVDPLDLGKEVGTLMLEKLKIKDKSVVKPFSSFQFF